jgi:hypothetical protein
MSFLHIVNGDSTRMGLERAGVPGRIVSWGDVLHEGPTPAGVSAEQWRRVRVRYLAGRGFGTEADIARRAGEDDALLDTWSEYEEIVLWFEHDLYDQLILIRHLDWMSRLPGRGAARFSLICGATYLGPLEPRQLAALFPTRALVAEVQIELGARAWQAFCASEPQALERLSTADTSALPFLAGALRRHFEEYPSVRNGLSRSQQQILDAVDAGSRTVGEAFGACARMEERIFMGDSTFFSIAGDLASAAHPLITLDRSPEESLPAAGSVALTTLGRNVRTGSEDHVRLNGIDAWRGGVHLTVDRCYRWSGDSLVLTRS